MTGDDPNGGRARDGAREDGRRLVSRRHVLEVTAAAGAISGLGGLGAAQQGGETTIELVGRVEGWVYEGDLDAPFIGGGEEQNPTLVLQPGTEYAVVWENADGLPHNFVIRDAEGNDLVRSEIITEEGATQTVTFTAEEGMTTYLCEVHPTSMVGDVRTGAGPTPTETGPSASAGFFEAGTEVGVETVAGGMTAPTDFAVADAADERYFVTDQTGEVWIVTGEGRRTEPFVDVSDRMVTLGEFAGDYASAVQDYDERGLLGIAFHPEFSTNRRFYLHYSAPPDQETPENWDHVEVLSEFVATEDGSEGRLDSERILLQLQSPQYNHDAGPMAFGPDGYLYFPMGDGGGANDSMYGHVPDWYERNDGGNGQDVEENLLGDVLRIDVDSRDGELPYGIPEDNPFAGADSPGRDEIYAYGFRNPFGISFDSRGNLFVADAGQNLWEEANVVERGGNYGWNVREGTHCFSADNPAEPGAIEQCPTSAPAEPPYDGAPLRDPVVEFPHVYRDQSVGITIVGGHRYEQSTVPELEGKYVFGAWTTDPARAEPAGRLLAATPPDGFDATGTPTRPETAGEPTPGTPTQTDGDGTTEPEGVPREELWEMEELVVAGREDGTLGYFVRMFGRDPDGEIYVLGNRRGIPEGDTGVVLRLVPPGDGETLEGGTVETEVSPGTGTPQG